MLLFWEELYSNGTLSNTADSCYVGDVYIYRHIYIYTCKYMFMYIVTILVKYTKEVLALGGTSKGLS